MVIKILLSSSLLIKISKIVFQHIYETFIFMEANNSEISLCKELVGKFSLHIRSVVKAQDILL